MKNCLHIYSLYIRSKKNSSDITSFKDEQLHRSLLRFNVLIRKRMFSIRSPIPPCYDRIEVDLTPQSALFRISGCFIGDSTPMVESVTSSFSVSSRVEVFGLRLIKSGQLVLTPSLWSHACNACREIKRYVETEESAKGAYGGRAGCIG